MYVTTLLLTNGDVEDIASAMKRNGLEGATAELSLPCVIQQYEHLPRQSTSPPQYSRQERIRDW